MNSLICEVHKNHNSKVNFRLLMKLMVVRTLKNVIHFCYKNNIYN